MALGDIYLPFTWQAWHLVTSTSISCGRCGTWRHLPSFCVAGVALGDIGPSFHVPGVALGDIHLGFAWQACLGHWAGSGGALGLGLVAGDAAALCVAGVALGDIRL